MDIKSQGSDKVWRASELDVGTQCARKLGYSRLGAVSRTTGEALTLRPQYSWDLVGGIAIDDTLCALHLGQIAGSSMLSGSALGDYYTTQWMKNTESLSTRGDIIGEEERRRSIFSDGVGALNIYVHEFAPRMEPVGVQVEGQIHVGDLTLVGHIDLIYQTKLGDGSKTQVITDWKFTKKTPSQMPAKDYVRGWAYDLMKGDGSGQSQLIYLRKGLKNPKVESDSHFVTEAEHKQVRLQLKTLAALYSARYFPMTDPSNWWCGADWCGFHAICRGNPDGPALIPGEAILNQENEQLELLK